MSSVVLTGDTSGAGTITVPAVAGTFTATIGSATGTHYPFTSGTAVASTSGTSIDFTGIPSWVKRITVMFAGISTSGTSPVQVQLGDAGGVEVTGYAGQAGNLSASPTTISAGFVCIAVPVAAGLYSGSMSISLLGSNTWAANSTVARSDLSGTTGLNLCAGSKALSDTLTQVRITTVGGTDTFDAGSINILYE
jgi:hypothetical protein